MSSDKDREVARRITALYDAAGFQEGKPLPDLRTSELEARLDVYLGDSYDSKKRGLVSNIQRKAHANQADLVRKLSAGSISRAEYAARFRQLTEETFNRLENALGATHFRTVFGAPAKDVAAFFDEEICGGPH